MSLLINSEIYTLWAPELEENFEKVVKEHISDIFGENIIFCDVKTRISTRAGKSTIPDGVLLKLGNPSSFYFVEYELSHHPPWEHIVSQINRFHKAYQNYDSKQKLINLIYAEIKDDPEKGALIKLFSNENDIHYYISSILSKEPISIILIDEMRERHIEILEYLPRYTRMIEFKTYYNNKVGLDEHIHLFEPLYSLDNNARARTKKENIYIIQYQMNLEHTFY